MREVLFKAKRLDNGEWVEGFYVSSENKHYIVKSMTDLGMTFSFVDVQEIDPNTLSQSTGLLDKNGNKIFEGDIIKIPNNYSVFGKNAGEIYEIYFGYGGFRMKPKYNKNSRGFYLEDDKTYAIIGNIHDTERTQ